VRVALISSIIPADTTGGELILYRHLVKEKLFDLTIVDGSPKARANASSTNRIMARLQKSRLAPFIEDCWAFRRGHWLDAKCKKLCNQSFDCVLTVAHGDAFCGGRISLTCMPLGAGRWSANFLISHEIPGAIFA